QGVLFRQRPVNDWPFVFDVVRDGSGGFIAIWDEFNRNTSWDLVLQQVSRNGKLGDVITLVENIPNPNVPEKYFLFQNYPNPFNPETEIRFVLRDSGVVSFVIYDLTGKEVITLLNDKRPAGEHRLTWDGRDKLGQSVASGIYFYRLRVNDFEAVRKMVYIR
ncbi:T9SS type A sorting domain-containing protein, partial [candidate division KSB1 bacterium]|nr:T9SS type A sorting domain-containing protein [candidate division KSB1 bacterium]NIR73153.1 T9SS type A sorting domain-containing protein [candidate division KSB1 bacterium]NIS23856.1 T9SS type A sorting domain-containing protein [candidate division KSB1 bacterium]NIT70777.1 T9SS type A sorting domain-containing protein [candidate division KSB1 bacterium]NIU24505.1 T9SS type A sorting domain-containing protein [candidate division KSB1 bacterium]